MSDDDITQPQLREIKTMLADHIDYTRTQFVEHQYTIQQNRASVDNLASDFDDHRRQEDADRLVLIDNMREFREKLEQLEPVVEAIHGIDNLARLGNWFKKLLLWLGPVGAFFIGVYEYLEHLKNPQ